MFAVKKQTCIIPALQASQDFKMVNGKTRSKDLNSTLRYMYLLQWA